MLYFNSVFAEMYCVIMVIYCYGNFILHILSAFMMIRIAKFWLFIVAEMFIFAYSICIIKGDILTAI